MALKRPALALLVLLWGAGTASAQERAPELTDARREEARGPLRGGARRVRRRALRGRARALRGQLRDHALARHPLQHRAHRRARAPRRAGALGLRGVPPAAAERGGAGRHRVAHRDLARGARGAPAGRGGGAARGRRGGRGASAAPRATRAPRRPTRRRSPTSRDPAAGSRSGSVGPSRSSARCWSGSPRRARPRSRTRPRARPGPTSATPTRTPTRSPSPGGALIGVGAAAMAAGLVWALVDQAAERPAVAIGPGGVLVRGSF